MAKNTTEFRSKVTSKSGVSTEVEKSGGARKIRGAKKRKVGSSKPETFVSIVTRIFVNPAKPHPMGHDWLATIGVNGHSMTALASDTFVRGQIADHLQSELERGSRGR